jgi:D-hexose-6-phosphate mutarotase
MGLMHMLHGCLMQVYLFGATVTSWKQPSGDEVLYVRPDAVFDKSKPISGGIPHCFPQVPALLILSCSKGNVHIIAQHGASTELQ